MKYIKSFLIVLLLFTCLPFVSFAELNNAKDEDTQTIAFEIVGNNTPSGDANGKNPLPKTGEVGKHFSLVGLGVIVGSVLLISFQYKKGKRDYEAK